MLYATVVENARVGGKVVQRTVLNIGRVEPEQVPYLKAAWAKDKPRLVRG
ncbi:MAG TPA: 2-C-methyl-D-erythritol 4-phosphate cytidylyltransferase [Eggerthellaceae bacterium]|nr:2-C-methyl-D-erythritol 4-phosphate cytidylyltransferase [Eggerthellaceae bacterium]